MTEMGVGDELGIEFDTVAEQLRAQAPPPPRNVTDAPGITVGEPEDNQGLEPVQEPTEAPERLRDPDTGQFTTPEKLWGGQFGTPEELEADYKQRVGSMANELGELRREREQIGQHLQTLARERQLQQQQMSEDELTQWEEYTLDNPADAAMQAIQGQNKVVYERVMDTWFTADPKGAARFELAQAMAQMHLGVQNQLGQHVRPLQENHAQQELGSAVMAMKQKYPDFDQVISSPALNDAAQMLGGQQYVEAMARAPLAEKARSLEVLYHLAGRLSGLQPQATSAEVTASDQLAGRLQAAVASPSSIPSGGTPGVSGTKQAFNDLWEQGQASMSG